MDESTPDTPGAASAHFQLNIPAPPSWSLANYIGRGLTSFLTTTRGLIAFAMIILTVTVTKFGVAREVTFAAIYQEQARTGKRVLPMFLLLSAVLGFVVIGETITFLNKFNVGTTVLGPIMVAVVVRELGPLLTAMLVLARSGTRNVIELGTARALGEVDALEALRIDPIHYLVMPRVIGMGLAVFALTIYFILGTLASGYIFAFLNNVPLQPDEYVHALTASLTGMDFAILAMKSGLFGILIAIITCYHGLARPIRIEEVSGATTRAVGQSVAACVVADAIFLMVYMLT